MSEQSSDTKIVKTFVTDAETGSNVPFLRGILTGSLQNAGLPFKAAYKLATHIRRDLADVAEISNGELRALVAEHIANRSGKEAFTRYMNPRSHTRPIEITDHQRRVSDFSQERLVRSLESCALATEAAYMIAARAHRTLIDSRVSEIESIELSRIVYQELLASMDETTARRYLVWLEYQHSGRPLIVLIGGTNGSGKSTIASEIAHHLNIVRTQSTDMLREVMRKMVAKRLLPVLHASSFKAWETLPTRALDHDDDRLLIDGYITQSDHVAVACNGALRRAMNEKASMILEGIHIHPQYCKSISKDEDVIVVPIMLAALKPEQLKRQITGREDRQPTRRAERYLKSFEEIWKLQSFLLSEADQYRVAIIENGKVEKTVDKVLNHISDVLMQKFTGDPQRVLELSS